MRVDAGSRPHTRATRPSWLGRQPRAGEPLVVSVSGDGGYNEVVNGVMQAGNDRRSARCRRRATPTTTAAPPRSGPSPRRSPTGRQPHRPAAAHCRGAARASPVRPLVHRAGADAGRGGRPREGRQGLAAGDGHRRPRLRQVPPVRDPGRGRNAGALRQPGLREHRADGQGRHAERGPGHPGRRDVRGDHARAHRQVAHPGHRREGGSPGWASSRA